MNSHCHIDVNEFCYYTHIITFKNFPCREVSRVFKKAHIKIERAAHVLFLDLVKPYDSVNQQLLCKILKLYGIPDELIIVLKQLDTNVTYIMKVGGKEVKITGEVGVK
jgi:hypothetical protein